MSAFMVSAKHIDYMVSAAILWHIGKNPQELAAMLERENLASIEHRYPDCIGHPENRPGGPDRERDIGERAVRLEMNINPVWVIKAVKCFEYQSCEHDGWEGSAAQQLCRDLINHAIDRLPGYDAAPWGID